MKEIKPLDVPRTFTKPTTISTLERSIVAALSLVASLDSDNISNKANFSVQQNERRVARNPR